MPESFQTTVGISGVFHAQPDFFQGGRLLTLPPPRAGTVAVAVIKVILILILIIAAWSYVWWRLVSVCLSVYPCVCPVPALTFECLDPETSFLASLYILITSRSSTKSWDQGQGHTSVTKYTFAGGTPSSERQSYLLR